MCHPYRSGFALAEKNESHQRAAFGDIDEFRRGGLRAIPGSDLVEALRPQRQPLALKCKIIQVRA